MLHFFICAFSSSSLPLSENRERRKLVSKVLSNGPNLAQAAHVSLFTIASRLILSKLALDTQHKPIPRKEISLSSLLLPSATGETLCLASCAATLRHVHRMILHRRSRELERIPLDPTYIGMAFAKMHRERHGTVLSFRSAHRVFRRL